MVFQMVKLQNFQAEELLITIKDSSNIGSTDGIFIQQYYINKHNKLKIGPIFVRSQDIDNNLSNAFDNIINFLSYNDSIKMVMGIFNEFSLFLYLLNTIQPSCLLILKNTNYSNFLYQFIRIFTTFIFQDMPDQTIIKSDKRCSAKLTYLVNICDSNDKKEVYESKFQRLGMSYNFPISATKVLNQFILLTLIYSICAYIREFKFTSNNQLVSSKRENQDDKLIQRSNLCNFANKIANKIYTIFFFTLEANILLISISVYLQLTIEIKDC
ncbi:hypothetical protein ABPG72_009967 [Tetrahymena utriculariae]